MSDIVFACQHCGQSLAIEDSAAGMMIDCPKCLKQLIVPKASTEYPSNTLAEPSDPSPLSHERNIQTVDTSFSGSRDQPAKTPVASQPGKSIVADNRFFTRIRWIVGVISIGMILSIIMACIHLQKIHRVLANHITYRDIQKTFLPTSAAAQVPRPKSVPEIKFSDTIKKYYPGRSSRELLEWLEKIDPERRADFVANLTEVIGEAEALKAPDMRAVIDGYKRQKMLTPDFRAAGVYSARPTILALISFVVFLIGMLLAFFSLLMILLAVEKKAYFHEKPVAQ